MDYGPICFGWVGGGGLEHCAAILPQSLWRLFVHSLLLVAHGGAHVRLSAVDIAAADEDFIGTRDFLLQ